MKNYIIKTDRKFECTKNSNNGITLIALVVTIVVLLILAGITINMLFSENGIITKAQESARKTAEAEKSELAGMESVVGEVDEILNSIGTNNKFSKLFGELDVTYTINGKKTYVTATIDGYSNLAQYSVGKLQKFMENITTEEEKVQFMLNFVNMEMLIAGEEKVKTREEAEKIIGQDLIKCYNEINDSTQQIDLETIEDIDMDSWYLYFAQIIDNFSEENLDDGILEFIQYSGGPKFESAEELLEQVNNEGGTSYETIKDAMGAEIYYTYSSLGILFKIGCVEFEYNGVLEKVDYEKCTSETICVEYAFEEEGKYKIVASNAFTSKEIEIEYAPTPNEYGFYYDTFYVGNVYSNLLKFELNVSLYFMENHVCFYRNNDDGTTNSFYWDVTEGGKITILAMNAEITIKDGNILESGTDSSVEVDKDYKIVATKNEHGFYYDVAYFLKNTENKNSDTEGDCIAAFVLLDSDGNKHDEVLWSSGKRSIGAFKYDISDYTFSNNGKTIIDSNGTTIYEIPEYIYDLQ